MKYLKDWIFDDTTNTLGLEVLASYSDTAPNNRKIYAISVREKFDNKKEVKCLPFFVTGDSGEELIKCWVANDKSIYLSGNTLFLNKKASE